MALREDVSATRSVTAFIAADPMAVWRIVSDVPRTATWSAEVVSCSWDTDVDPVRGPEPGQTFTGELAREAMQWTSRSVVTSSDPGRRFAFAVSGTENPTAVWSYDLEPEAGGCRVQYRVTLGDGPSMFDRVNPHPSARRELERARLNALADAMRATLAEIALAAEAGR